MANEVLVETRAERYAVLMKAPGSTGQSRFYHAVNRKSLRPLCGLPPANGWLEQEGEAVTCARCLVVLSYGRETRTPTQHTWDKMKQRCLNPAHRSYKHYGGRGITIDPRWIESFENFIEDMGERPKGRTLDRHPDRDGPYCKANCRWATIQQQARTRRNTAQLTAFGKTQTLTEWCTEYGVSVKVVRQRIKKYSWPLEDALTMKTVRAPKGSGRTFLRVPMDAPYGR